MNKQQAKERLAALDAERAELQKILDTPEITPAQRFWQLWSGLTMKIDKEKYPDTTFWFKGDECWVEWNHKDGYLWLKYSTIWSVFETEYGLGYDDIQRFIKIEVEEHFKCKPVTPNALDLAFPKLEEHFKYKSVTPVVNTYTGTRNEPE